MRKEDPAAYPACPPHLLLANRENSFLRMVIQKPVYIDCSQLLLLLIYTIYLHSSFRFGHSSQMQTFLLPATLVNGILFNVCCIPKSCDYSINVHHVQPPLICMHGMVYFLFNTRQDANYCILEGHSSAILFTRHFLPFCVGGAGHETMFLLG